MGVTTRAESNVNHASTARVYGTSVIEALDRRLTPAPWASGQVKLLVREVWQEAATQGQNFGFGRLRGQRRIVKVTSSASQIVRGLRFKPRAPAPDFLASSCSSERVTSATRRLHSD